MDSFPSKAAFGILFIEHLPQRHYPALRLAPVNHWEARARAAGRAQILTPLELLDRLAALLPPPRVHRHRYFGVLAPNRVGPW